METVGTLNGIMMPANASNNKISNNNISDKNSNKNSDKNSDTNGNPNPNNKISNNNISNKNSDTNGRKRLKGLVYPALRTSGMTGIRSRLVTGIPLVTEKIIENTFLWNQGNKYRTTIDTTSSSLELEQKIKKWNTVYATCGKIQVENCIAAVHKETKDTPTEETKETETDTGASSPIRKEKETTQTTSPSVQGVHASSTTTSTTSTTPTTSSICITQEEEYGLSLINIHQILSANVEPMRVKAPLPCGAAYRARKQARLVLHAMFPQMQMRLMEAIVLDTDFNMQAATEVALGMDPRLHGITE